MLLHKIHRFIISNIGTSQQKVRLLRKEGAIIGDNTNIYGDLATFGTEPYLIKVGKDCTLAYGVKLITHDGGVRVLNRLEKFGKGNKADIISKIEIGNNVYIGTNAMVLPGIRIGDNCVIGAGAVVTKDIPSNSVAVGVPAHVIKNIDEYYETHKKIVRYTSAMSAKDKKIFYEKIVFDDLKPEENNYGL